jgi:hypothetical protein
MPNFSNSTGINGLQIKTLNFSEFAAARLILSTIAWAI